MHTSLAPIAARSTCLCTALKLRLRVIQGTAVPQCWPMRSEAPCAALQVRKQCREAGPCDMGGFTRILHSGQADELMDEIPTFVCDPVPSDNKG